MPTDPNFPRLTQRGLNMRNVPSRFEQHPERPRDLVLKPACVWSDIFRKLAEYRAYKSLVV